VSDRLTNLLWQQQLSPTNLTWAEAKTYCTSGFRLPTVKELSSILDLTVVEITKPTIDEVAFPNTPLEGFWTSTPQPSGIAAWMVDFRGGMSTFATVTQSYRVRCVR
jgi:hypothetical protein